MTYDPVQLRPHYIDFLKKNELTEFPTISNMSRGSLEKKFQFIVHAKGRTTGT